MAIATGTAILGAAAIGGAGSIYSANKQSKAAKDAAKAQAKGNDAALQFQREGRAIAEGELRPYVNRGNAASGMIMSHLGLGGGAPQNAVPSYNGPFGSASVPTNMQANPASAYLQQNPDVMDAYRQQQSAPGFRQKFGTPEQYAQWHFQNYGQSEGRQWGTPQVGGAIAGGQTGVVGAGGGRNYAGTGYSGAMGSSTNPGGIVSQAGSSADYQTPDQAQESAWESYLKTPYAKIGRFEADKASGEFLDRAGSTGTTLSGRTVRGMGEVGEEAAMRNFYGYMGALGGVADQGFSASSGIASAGQNFANNASNLSAATGAANAQAKAASGSAWADGIADVAGWAGWAAGNWPGGGGSTGGGGSGIHSGATANNWLN